MGIRYVGLEVHKGTIVIAVAKSGNAPAAALGTFPNELTGLLKQLKKLGSLKDTHCCYEAGPTGFGLYRALNKAGAHCIVVAPSLVPVKTGSRIKTDRRDAIKLAHFLRSGDLTEVFVPNEATEAMRDLERARGDARKKPSDSAASTVEVPSSSRSTPSGKIELDSGRPVQILKPADIVQQGGNLDRVD